MAKNATTNQTLHDFIIDFGKWVDKKKTIVRDVGIHMTTLNDIRSVYKNSITVSEDLDNNFIDELYKPDQFNKDKAFIPNA